MSYHKMILVGRLGGDPEMRYTPSGTAVTNFSIAVDDSYTNNNGERMKRTIWFRIAAWGKLGETCNQYLKKGRMALVEGRMTVDAATGGPRVWTGQDGSPRASYEVTAQNVRFLSSRQEDQTAAASGGGASNSGANYGAGNAMEPPQEDEIPF